MRKPGTWFAPVHGEILQNVPPSDLPQPAALLASATACEEERAQWTALIVALLGSTLLGGCAASSNNAESTLGPSPAEAASRSTAQTNTVTAKPIRVAKSGSPAATGGYTIGALDVLDISVFQVPELTKTVQVANTGTINLPLVGEVPVVGKTPQQVERDLTASLEQNTYRARK